MGHNKRRALSRLALSGQLLSGAKRCWPYKMYVVSVVFYEKEPVADTTN
jgi:hypothetical protein